MTTFAVQYLGTRPKEATPKKVRQRLHQAFDHLPISMVLLDWDLPPALEEAVAKETQAHMAKLYRWQTWLTGDLHTDLPSEWAVIGANGQSISGYANEPDFTFICPNHNGVEEFLAERLETIAARGVFQGVFLDRIRFPSPAADPSARLGCFCPQCVRLAADRGVDLRAAQADIQGLSANKNGVSKLCQGLFGITDDSNDPFTRYLDFRENCITRVIDSARKQANAFGLELGLDCFSPALTRMVAQDLKSLRKVSDWIKIMTYPRVFGPAGISFELFDLLDWLISHNSTEQEALELIQESSGLALPSSRADLRRCGLGSGSISQEIQHGRIAGLTALYAGIALVEVKNVHESTPDQIYSDLLACKGADGLVLSWDLWKIPFEYLELIRRLWENQ